MTSKLPFSLLILTAVVTAVATFVEAHYGTAYARQHIYGAWWFIALWGVTALAGCWLLYKKKVWRCLPVFLLHVSFVLILLGAFITHVTSRSGMTHLREGEVTCTYWVKNEQGAYVKSEMLPFYLALRDFRILYDADGVTPSDYVSQVVVSTKKGKEKATISMNKIGRVEGYRIYQTSFDEDERGSVFTISYDPWGTGITYAGYLLLAFSMLMKRSQESRVESQESRVKSQERNVLDLQKNTQGEKLSSLPSPLSALDSRLLTLPSPLSPLHPEILLSLCGTAMASYMVIAICQSPLLPVLRSPFLFVHVGTIMLSYILLVTSIVRRKVLRPAVFLLAVGIFLGAVWANVSWGTYWSWDPKESWALVTLLIYSLPLHEKSLPWFRSTRNYRIYSILALASLLMTYFGVNFLGGMHSYQ